MDIEEACNGAVAVQMYSDALLKQCGCRDRAYRLIIMDLQMPIMGGMEASRIIMDLANKASRKCQFLEDSKK